MFVNKRLLPLPTENKLLSTMDLGLVGGGLSNEASSVSRLVFTPLALKVGLTCLMAQFVLYAFFRSSQLEGGQWSAAPSYAAHQVIVFPMMLYLVWQGLVEWFSEGRQDSTAMDRIVQGNYFSDIILGMMVWDIPVTAFTPKLRNMPMMIHHVAMVVTAALSMGVWSDGTRLFGYYAPFFFGLTEVSTLPLVIMEFLNSNPDLVSSNTWLQRIHGFAGPLFAFLFLTIRAIYFSYVSVTCVLPDIVKVASKGIYVKPLYTMALLNVLFTLLQLYWGSLVVQEIIKLGRAS